MISASNESLLISTLGWVDGGSVWCYSTTTETSESVRLSDAQWLSVLPGRDDAFSVVHHFPGTNDTDIAVHLIQSVKEPLARLRIRDGVATFDGEREAWYKVPRHYASESRGAALLLWINPERQEVQKLPLEWYSDGRYDLGYQGIVGATEIPGTDRVLFSVQRSSQLVIYDCDRRAEVGQIDLAGRGGNPTLEFRSSVLWASDYDTMLRLDTENWRILKARQLQEANRGTRQFIGDFVFDVSGDICVVARPFSGDVVAIDKKSLKPKMQCKTGRQPLDVGVLSDGRIIARDWKTGDLLKGTLSRKFWGL